MSSAGLVIVIGCLLLILEISLPLLFYMFSSSDTPAVCMLAALHLQLLHSFEFFCSGFIFLSSSVSLERFHWRVRVYTYFRWLELLTPLKILSILSSSKFLLSLTLPFSSFLSLSFPLPSLLHRSPPLLLFLSLFLCPFVCLLVCRFFLSVCPSVCL